MTIKLPKSLSFETLAAALIIGLFAIFIVVYTVCLQCCWSNRRCPWFLGKEDNPKDKFSFCPCVQSLQSPDSWHDAAPADLELVTGNNVQDIEAGLSWEDPLALIFVNMNVQVIVCDCGKAYKMSPDMARKFYATKKDLVPTTGSKKQYEEIWRYWRILLLFIKWVKSNVRTVVVLFGCGENK